MKNRILTIFILLSGLITFGQKPFEYKLESSSGEINITILGHSSVKFEWRELVIYVDPYQKIYDFSKAPLADVILITHQDDDHFDNNAISKIKGDSTLMVYTQTCFEKKPYNGKDTIMGNGDSIFISDIGIKAVPAYNIINSKHVKGVGNGYILTFNDKRVYLAGDTEVVPEMADIKNIDLAFFGYSSLNMTTSMFIEAANMINPDVVIPYHYDNKDISGLLEEFESQSDITILTGVEISTVSQLSSDLKCECYIFPNPASDFCFIVFTDEIGGTLEVFSLDGKQVIKKGFEHNMQIDISDLKKGLYIAIVKTDKIIKSFKLTIN